MAKKDNDKTRRSFLMAAIVVILLIVASFLLGGETANTSQDGDSITFETVASEVFREALLRDTVVLLDMRTPEEYGSGTIRNSVNIDFYDPNFRNELRQLDKDAEYKIYCNSGNRSRQAMDMMKSLGFTNVTELNGGIQSWIKKGFEVCTNC